MSSSTAEYHAKLKDTPLFSEFTRDELMECLDLLDPVHANSGDCIVRQDDAGDAMFLLVEGQARVVHHRDGREIELAILKTGDFFGELALVDKGPRSADVEAQTDCTLLKISHAALAALAGVYPSAAFKFLIAIGRLLVGRLRQSNQRYIDSLLVPGVGKE
jgi:CRP-like cAMP-binding protein